MCPGSLRAPTPAPRVQCLLGPALTSQLPPSRGLSVPPGPPDHYAAPIQALLTHPLPSEPRPQISDSHHLPFILEKTLLLQGAGFEGSIKWEGINIMKVFVNLPKF